MHFAVPMAGAVLNNLNTRLNARTMAAQLSHCEPKIIIVDYQFLSLVNETLSLLKHKPLLVVIEEMENDKEIGNNLALTQSS